ncbi:hypothetical protein CORC01_04854 [Colletotrichum orchidophilum]|uniref:Uncharacterized protein n=1 Tax=Colletotrichum orchidophilum TaxID=1209926 RepID=A0A1G4BF05_9PEZI|nr:uncharacterized protein CORC01_04854 [Colletotrichum orchidophilum]OHE99953.1 hypothetical protein CORC01_04854 [Colletotrichum orchidophilum]
MSRGVLLMAPTAPLTTIILQEWDGIAMVRQGRHGHHGSPSRPRAALCRPNWPHTHSLSHVAWIVDSPREHGSSDGRLRPVFSCSGTRPNGHGGALLPAHATSLRYARSRHILDRVALTERRPWGLGLLVNDGLKRSSLGVELEPLVKK